MNKFKRKSLCWALAAGFGAIGVAGTASAVHVNPEGTGQVLIYPYYTVRTAATPAASGEYNTYLSVVNTTTDYKALKVRFVEGKNSREVLDFNLFLSPKDVWAAALVPTSDGAKIILNPTNPDKSCTFGVINVPAGEAFKNGKYSGSAADGETASMDRTREGHFEILEMGIITDSVLQAAVNHTGGVAPCDGSFSIAGVPYVHVLTDSDATLNNYLSAPSGGLFGAASLINPATGVDYTYDAVALENWRSTSDGTNSESALPTIASANWGSADVFMVNGTVASATYSAGWDMVSGALTRNNVMNEYVLDTNTKSATDWVVTFPTKRFYLGLDGGSATIAGNVTARPHGAAGDPFTENFGIGGSCDTVGKALYDREEQTPAGGGFSGGTTTPLKLCWEANVVTFNQPSVGGVTTSAILGSINTANINTTYQNGWLTIGFIQSFNNMGTGTTHTSGSTFWGLPVVGFMVQDFINGNLNGVASNYGGNFVHKYQRSNVCGGLYIAC